MTDSQRPSARPRRDTPTINLDGRFSVSWKTASSIILTVMLLVTGWGAYVTSLATDKDIKLHEQHPESHKMIVVEGGPLKSLPQVIREHDVNVRSLETRVNAQEDVIVTVRNGFFDYRAEELADRAADKIKSRTRSREVWKRVKAKALDNLENKRPIREGLEHLLFESQ